jgi:thymidine kinase
MGKITLILGPMMSGKSTELVRRAERAKFAKKSVCVVRPQIDTREYFTHSKMEIEVDVITTNDPWSIIDLDYDLILIDEAQFFNDNLGAAIWKTSLKRDVVLSAMNGDSDQKPWSTISELLPIIDDIVYKTGVCVDCGSEYGTFSYYKGTKSDKIIVGGADQYVCLCRDCVEKRNQKKRRDQLTLVV